MSDKFSAFWRHPWTVAACNIALVMLLYSLSRLFFILVNHDIFPTLTPAHILELCLGGMRFDLTAVLYLSSVYLLMLLLPLRTRADKTYSTVADIFFLLPNILGLIVNNADTVYFRFTDRRTTCRFFTEFASDNNLLSVLLQAVVQYWYVTLFTLLSITLLLLLFRYRCATGNRRIPWFYYLTETVVCAVSIYFIVIGIRGGFGRYTRPITISNATQYTDRPNETAIVLNTPFSLMKSVENTTYQHPHYFPDSELENIWTPLHTPATAEHRTDNVVIFILESFSKEYFGFYNRALDGGTYTGYTPMLDSLLAYSRSYTHSYASGRKSIDAMPSVLSSIPMLIEPYIVTPYSTNDIASVASCLGSRGYTTAFFHGAPNGSMGFQAYARSAGFDRYYGMDEYNGPDAFDGTWAIWDEEFLQFFARTMDTLPEPFCTAVFTASSHHPFRIPERYAGSFAEGTHPLHKCIGYSDYALRRFFETARTQPWFEHTLFVFTADHTNHLTHPEYTNAKGLYEVPLFFYKADNSLAGISDEVVSQTDIMPSVLAWTGYDEPFVAFGQDVLTQKKTEPYAVCYNHPVYQIMSDSLLLQFDGERTTALYNTLRDPLLTNNIAAEKHDTAVTAHMEQYLRAYIQQYITRMTDNRLTPSRP